MRISFQIIPHSHQRYPTVGDYLMNGGWLSFRVSRMKDKRYPVLVFLHEIIEFFMCRLAGVKMKAIDKFDMEYERTRLKKPNHSLDITDETICNQRYRMAYSVAPCGCAHKEEPGDDPHAPYYLQHQTATQCEKLIAKALGVDWKKYNDTVESL